MAKRYGLIVPGKDKPTAIPTPVANFTKPSVFGDDDSDSDNGTGPVLSKMRPASIGPGVTERRQARIIQQKALAEDPTIFQYDELYDNIETQRDVIKTAKSKEVKAPKYIKRLLQEADRRKLENERRIERTVQKEREAEGEEFKDKESYVTSGYRKKLEEIQEAEEKEKREDYLESIGDVRKQQDLGGFYRHIYEQTMGVPKEIVVHADIEKSKNDDINGKNKDLEETNVVIKNQSKKTRTYRKRQLSVDEDNDPTNTKESDVKDENVCKKSHLQSNLDADSDFSIDSSTEEDDDDNDSKNTQKIEVKEPTAKIVLSKPEESNDKIITNDKTATKDVKNDEITDEICEKNEIEIEKKVKKPKIDIWKKRTIGDVFDAALQRYFARKAARNG